MHTRPVSELQRFLHSRWLILFFSVLSMVAVANFQYGWTLFVPPLQKHLHAEQAAIQVTFTLFVLLETWLVPFEGWLVDRFGPRLLVILGGILAGLGWVGAGRAETVTQLYLTYAVAGTPQFWVMYALMTLVATGGLMATAQLNPMAVDFKVDKIPVHFLFLTMPALQFALSADRVLNGICRPFWGWISDHIGRERTMTIAFTLEALAIFLLIKFASDPKLFVVFSAFTFFGWGEIYSLMPAICGDFFGRKHATQNYGFLYTAKGTASVFVPIGSALAAGKAFDFRADVLLLLGRALAFFSHFLAPTVLRLDWRRKSHDVLFGIGLAIVAYGIVLTVVPQVWTPFSARLGLPKIGWPGVFAIAILFDLTAAALAFFVLRKMKVPARGEA